MAPPNNPADDATDDSIDFGDMIDQATFDQVLEMDEEDDDREFSKGIIFSFFDQAVTTFAKMKQEIENRQLPELSSLGHFLKGSSATIGLTKVKDACEKIQHYGAHKDESGNPSDMSDDTCLKLIQKALEDAEAEYQEVSRLLRRFYGE